MFGRLLPDFDPRLGHPSPQAIGHQVLQRASDHVLWEMAWEKVTGESWDAYQAKVEEGRRWYAAMHSQPARFDVVIDPHAELSRVEVTAGIVPAFSVDVESVVGKNGSVLVLRVPTWYADIRTSPARS